MADTVKASRRPAVARGAWAWPPCLLCGSAAAARGERFRPPRVGLAAPASRGQLLCCTFAWGPNRGRVRCSPASAECRLDALLDSGQPQRACSRPHVSAKCSISHTGRESSPRPRTQLVSKQFLYYPRALLIRVLLVLLLVAPGLRRRRVRASSLLLDLPQPRRLGAQFVNLVPQDAVLGLVGLPT